MVFCGKPWIWCALQNFGDCVYLGGALGRIHADLPAARRDPAGARLCGLGFVNEGLDYNPVVFDFLFEQAWRPEPVELGQWLSEYARRVHGAADAHSQAAWAALKDTAFTGQHEVAVAYTLPPSLHPADDPPYNNEGLLRAWRELLDAAPAAGDSDAVPFRPRRGRPPGAGQLLGPVTAPSRRRVARESSRGVGDAAGGWPS